MNKLVRRWRDRARETAATAAALGSGHNDYAVLNAQAETMKALAAELAAESKKQTDAAKGE